LAFDLHWLVPWLKDIWLWDRYNEFATLVFVFFLLANNLISKVPGKNQHIFGMIFREF
jgi:hypothetical protein